MIEELNKKSLKKCGFDAETIERLFTWRDYECNLKTNQGYFFASNKENKIYSGKEGKQKQFDQSIFPEHHSEPKEKFKTFDELFRYAVMVGSISIPVSQLSKQFEYKNAEHSHNFSFNVWLQHFKGWEYGNEITYIENLTRENWVEYLAHCEKEASEQKEKAEKIKSNWKPKAFSPQQAETEAEHGTPTFKNNFDNINTVEIYDHFKAGLVDIGYLTEQELNEYLKAAFELKTKPQTLFKLKHTPTKQKIYTVFYVYYKDISQKKKRKEYAALLGDYFEGYRTEIIQTNWARDYKTRR